MEEVESSHKGSDDGPIIAACKLRQQSIEKSKPDVGRWEREKQSAIFFRRAGVGDKKTLKKKIGASFITERRTVVSSDCRSDDSSDEESSGIKKKTDYGSQAEKILRSQRGCVVVENVNVAAALSGLKLKFNISNKVGIEANTLLKRQTK